VLPAAHNLAVWRVYVEEESEAAGTVDLRLTVFSIVAAKKGCPRTMKEEGPAAEGEGLNGWHLPIQKRASSLGGH